MAKSQENGTKFLPGLKDCKVEGVKEDKERVVIKMTVEVREMNCSYTMSHYFPIKLGFLFSKKAATPSFRS